MSCHEDQNVMQKQEIITLFDTSGLTWNEPFSHTFGSLAAGLLFVIFTGFYLLIQIFNLKTCGLFFFFRRTQKLFGADIKSNPTDVSLCAHWDKAWGTTQRKDQKEKNYDGHHRCHV